MKVTAKMSGGKEILLRLKQVAKGVEVATGFGTYEGLQIVMLDAKSRAPKETHAMAESGYVTAPSVSGGRVHIEAGFGGPSEDYVVRQHFDTGLNHPNGGEAMFFQNALDAHETDVTDAVARHVRDYLDTGRTQSPAKRVPQDPNEGVTAQGEDRDAAKTEWNHG